MKPGALNPRTILAATTALLLILTLSGCVCTKSPSDLADYINGDSFAGITGAAVSGGETEAATANATKNVTQPVELHNVGQALFMWKPYVCNYTNKKSLSTKWRSQMWMDEGKYHAKIFDGGHTTYHVLSDYANVYVWTEDKPVGTKYKVSEIKGLSGEIESRHLTTNKTVTIYTDLIDLMTASEVKCMPAILDEGTFKPPARTQFQPGGGVYDYNYDSQLLKYGKG